MMSCTFIPAPSAIPFHLLEEPLGDVLPLRGGDAADRPLGVEQVEARDLDLHLLALHVEQEADDLADVLVEQGALLIAHLVGRPLDVEDPVAVDLFQEPRAARAMVFVSAREGAEPSTTSRTIARHRVGRRGMVRVLLKACPSKEMVEGRRRPLRRKRRQAPAIGFGASPRFRLRSLSVPLLETSGG